MSRRPVFTETLGLDPILIAYFAWQRPKKDIKEIYATFFTNLELATIENEVQEDIQLFYKGTQVKSLYRIIVEIGNAGTKEININDYFTPIFIRLTEVNQIVEVQVIEKNISANIDVSITEGTEGKEVVIEPILLNPGNKFKIKIMTDGFASFKNIAIESHVAGVERIRRVDGIYSGAFRPNFERQYISLLGDIWHFSPEDLMANRQRQFTKKQLRRYAISHFWPILMLPILLVGHFWAQSGVNNVDKVLEEYPGELTSARFGSHFFPYVYAIQDDGRNLQLPIDEEIVLSILLRDPKSQEDNEDQEAMNSKLEQAIKSLEEDITQYVSLGDLGNDNTLGVLITINDKRFLRGVLTLVQISSLFVAFGIIVYTVICLRDSHKVRIAVGKIELKDSNMLLITDRKLQVEHCVLPEDMLERIQSLTFRVYYYSLWNSHYFLSIEPLGDEM